LLLRFSYKSHVTWLELKSFARGTQAKKHKKSQYFQETPGAAHRRT
jgi:hypothetical protein